MGNTDNHQSFLFYPYIKVLENKLILVVKLFTTVSNLSNTI